MAPDHAMAETCFLRTMIPAKLAAVGFAPTACSSYPATVRFIQNATMAARAIPAKSDQLRSIGIVSTAGIRVSGESAAVVAIWAFGALSGPATSAVVRNTATL